MKTNCFVKLIKLSNCKMFIHINFELRSKNNINNESNNLYDVNEIFLI